MMTPLRVQVVKRKKGYYLRVRAGNNRIWNIGGEPFSSRSAAKRSWLGMVDRIERVGFIFQDR